MNNALADRFRNYSDPTSEGALVPLSDLNYWTPEQVDAQFPNPFDFRRFGFYDPFRYDQTLFQEGRIVPEIPDGDIVIQFRSRVYPGAVGHHLGQAIPHGEQHFHVYQIFGSRPRACVSLGTGFIQWVSES